MKIDRRMFAVAAFSLALAVPAAAQEWSPAAYVDESTIEIRTKAAGEEERWFPVWIVVLDGQAYIRLGTRAAERVEATETMPHLGVRVAGQEFERIKTEEAPDKADDVAKAMAEKYWSDIFVRMMSHPLTLRLVGPE